MIVVLVFGSRDLPHLAPVWTVLNGIAARLAARALAAQATALAPLRHAAVVALYDQGTRNLAELGRQLGMMPRPRPGAAGADRPPGRALQRPPHAVAARLTAADRQAHGPVVLPQSATWRRRRRDGVRAPDTPSPGLRRGRPVGQVAL